MRGNSVVTSSNPERKIAGVGLYDPESLISGKEIAEGFTYSNSYRSWPDEVTFQAAVHGELSPETILEIAPRVFLPHVQAEKDAQKRREEELKILKTEHSDDYYPNFVCHFTPENLAINRNQKPYARTDERVK